MSKAVRDTDEVAELKQLYDRLALAIERAAATMHIRGADSTAFSVEDTNASPCGTASAPDAKRQMTGRDHAA